MEGTENAEHRFIKVECCVVEGMNGPLFRCTAFVDGDEEGLGVEGTSMSRTARELVRRLPGFDPDQEGRLFHINGPIFFGLRTAAIAKSVLPGATKPAIYDDDICMCCI